MSKNNSINVSQNNSENVSQKSPKINLKIILKMQTLNTKVLCKLIYVWKCVPK